MPNQTADPLSGIFKYFWLIFAATMVGNIFVWRRRLLTVVERGNANRDEVDTFVRWLALWSIGGPIVLDISQLAAGWTSPFCAYAAGASRLPVAALAIVGGTAAATMLLWVWRGRGADFLARVGPAFQRRPNYDKVYLPLYVRTYVTILVIIPLLTAVVSRAAVHDLPPEMCPISHTG